MNSRFEKKLNRLCKPPVLQRYFCTEEFPEDMPLARLQEFQKESLIDIVARAYGRCDFYRQKMEQVNVSPDDIQELEHLARLPFTTKDELRGQPWALLACDKEDISLIQVSTGTTGGEEIYIPYTWEDYYLHDLAPGYPSLVPVEHDDIVLNALPYEMSSAGLAFHKTFMEGCGATVIPSGRGGVYSTAAKTVKIMQDLRPTVVITTPSWAMELVEEAANRSIDLPSLTLKRMWLTGEGCSTAYRKRVEQLWGTIANFYYGSLEAGCIGIECDHQDGYHATLGHVIVEIVDPKTGRVLEPGEIGEIIVTCLLRYDTPLLRYRTQDLGYIEYDHCSCGVTLPKIYLRGRLVDQLSFKGVSLSPIYLEEFLLRMPEVGNHFQFVVDEASSERLKVRCELAPGLTPSFELADKLASKMEFGTGIPFAFELVERMPRATGKTLRVVHE